MTAHGKSGYVSDIDLIGVKNAGISMTTSSPDQESREPVLSIVERVSEMLFGLYMALTFIGAVSIADAGTDNIRKMMIAALGCNLAWGLVDAVMYVVRSLTERGRRLSLVQAVRAEPDAAAGCALLRNAFPRAVIDLVSPGEFEAIRQRLLALPTVPDRPRLDRNDFFAALGIFVIVVAATFPVVLPFMLLDNVDAAKNLSRAIALSTLFLGGLALGRYAGYGSWRTGLGMAGLGAVLVVAINALGG
jgi:hypothetical protein